MRLFLFLVFVLPQSLAGQNVLKNPGFESDGFWHFWGAQLHSRAHTGKYSIKVTNKTAKWSGADQVVYLPEEVYKVQVSGWMATENIVQGINSWEKSRISVEFHDSNNEMIGNYLPVVGETTGNSEFTFYNREYIRPEKASKLKVFTVLGNCVGSAWFDDLMVILYDGEGNILQSAELSGPKSEGAWYKIKTNPNHNGSHYVDWSSLLDKPAGRHGFLKAVGDHLEFEDGTPVKFWGTNLVAGDCFPDKSVADSTAARLAKMGCNLVRLHHMDAPWARPNIFGNRNGSHELSEESLQKLDYLIFKLKENGIYIYLDLLVHRDFVTNGGVLNKPPDLGGKQVGYFSDEIIKLQKKYISDLLYHKNHYTGLRYVDDPVIAGSEFINESTVFMHFGGDILNKFYREELEDLFHKMGYENKKLAVFDMDWSTGGTVRREGTEGDVPETIEFLNQIERNYFQTMTDHMRSIGVKYPLAGSNFPPAVLSYQKNNSRNDVVLTNAYWDHPQLWKIDNDWSRVLWAPIDNNSMIRSPKKSIIIQQSKHQWCHKPFMVTEFNIAYPNEYNLEGVPYMAAYSSLQGFDGVFQFHSGHDAIGAKRLGSFTNTLMPEHIASWVVAAPMFLRGDIQESEGVVVDRISPKSTSELPLYSDFLDRHYHLPYTSKVVKCDSGRKVHNEQAPIEYTGGNIVSETGQLDLDYNKGLFQFESSYSEGLIGNLNNGGESLELKTIKVETNNTWASVMLTSASREPITSSPRLYLTVVTPTKMKGDEFNTSRNALRVLGQGDIMAQVFSGRVTLKLPKNKSLIVYEKMTDGSRGEQIRVVNSADGYILNLAQGRSFVYEIEVN